MKRLLRVLDGTGDTRIEYELENPESLADARRAFDEAVRKGSSVFNVKPGSDETTQRIEDFSKLSEEAIIVPKITGG